MNDGDRLEQKYSGHWWLPRNAEMRLAGTMTFSYQDGVRLDLIGNFDDPLRYSSLGETILGETSSGEKITVHQAFSLTWERPFLEPHKGKSSFVATRAYVGEHFDTPEEACFTTLSFRPTYLNEWLRLNPIELKYEGGGFTASYVMPRLQSFPIDDALKVGIEFSLHGPSLTASLNALMFRQDATFTIDLAKPAHFDLLYELMDHLCNFLSLAIMSPIHVLDLEGRMARQEVLEEYVPWVRILLPVYTVPEQEHIYETHMLFKYSEVSDRLGDLLQNWFDKRDLLQPVHDLYFGVLNGPQVYPVTTFLNYVQALETYHSRRKSNEVNPREVHKQRMHAILEAAPREYRDWLTKALALSNMPSLAKRLRELIELVPWPSKASAGTTDRFIQAVRDTRNYYTHYNPDLKDKAASGGALKRLSMTLGSMIEAILLYETGFDLTDVRQMQVRRTWIPSVWR